MINFYAAGAGWGVPNLSPFVLKVDCYLRMVGLPYELCSFRSLADFVQAPKGKIPYIEDNGQKVADSGFILEYLQTTYGDRLGERLSQRDQAIALGMRRLMEEHLYFVIGYARYVEEEIWQQYKRMLFDRYGSTPTELVRCRDSPDPQRYSHLSAWARTRPPLACRSLRARECRSDGALSVLGGPAVLLRGGAHGPGSYGVANIFQVGYETPLEAHAKALPNLRAYCERMRQRYYSTA